MDLNNTIEMTNPLNTDNKGTQKLGKTHHETHNSSITQTNQFSSRLDSSQTIIGGPQLQTNEKEIIDTINNESQNESIIQTTNKSQFQSIDTQIMDEEGNNGNRLVNHSRPVIQPLLDNTQIIEEEANNGMNHSRLVVQPLLDNTQIIDEESNNGNRLMNHSRPMMQPLLQKYASQIEEN